MALAKACVIRTPSHGAEPYAFCALHNPDYRLMVSGVAAWQFSGTEAAIDSIVADG